ncbi:unannotated protein [freshwater metagenome]|uniref:Unannotated protein n=1 Tax=freshwater metagenome TaxID=449393 RepID=A0A6J7XSV8_9ZZZZ|nr:hypothetical protein [Actinomycetota bacterium]
MSNDLLATMRALLGKVSEGESSEVIASMSSWARESGEVIKTKVEEEVQLAVSRMGFIRREEFEKLQNEVAQLNKSVQPQPKASAKKSSSVKASAKKTTSKITPAKGVGKK